jgi:hypothetical protein
MMENLATRSPDVIKYDVMRCNDLVRSRLAENPLSKVPFSDETPPSALAETKLPEGVKV